MITNTDMVKKIVTGFLIFLLGISLIFNYQYFREKQDQQRQYDTFLNHYYSAVLLSLNSVNKLLDEELSESQINTEL